MEKKFITFFERLERNGKATVKGVKFFVDQNGNLYMNYGDGCGDCHVCQWTGLPSIDREAAYSNLVGQYPF